MKTTLIKKLDLRGIIILFALLVSLLSYQDAFATDTDNANSVQFYEGDFESAKLKAGTEGKLFFIDFYASWCMPCKWMDQTTFNDKRVATIMNENFVAIKIDIDEVKGFEIKNKYDIEYLPTMLIFNAQGKLIDRIEETLPANRLINILNSHNKKNNKQITSTQAPNVSPVQKNNSSQNDDDVTPFLDKKEIKSGYALLNRNRTYRLQMGVFDSYENAFEEVNALKKEFLEPIIVLNDFFDGGVRYKIMMGEFNSLKEANGFKKILQRDFNKNAIVQ